MIRRNATSIIRAAIATLITALVTSCGDFDDAVSPPPPATGESHVIGERVFGDGKSWSQVWGITPSGGDLVTWGLNNDLEYIAGTDPTLHFGWTRNDFTVVSVLGIDPGIAIAVGFEGELESDAVALVSTYDAQGGLLDSERVALAGGRRRLNDLVIRSTDAGVAHILAVGGGVEPGLTARVPYVTEFDVDQNGVLTVQSQKMFNELANVSFWEVVMSSDGTLFVGGPAAPGAENASVWSLSDALEIERVASLGLYTRLERLVIDQDELYMVGTNDYDSDTVHPSGFLARYALDGQQQWRKRIDITDGGEGYYDGVVIDGHLHAVGYTGSTWIPETQRTYGQALLTAVDAAGGSVIGHDTFGASSVESRFYSMTVLGTEVFCGGFTNRAVAPLGGQGWLVRVDLASIAASASLVINPPTTTAPPGAPVQPVAHRPTGR